MLILLNVVLFSFGFWNVFSDNRALRGILGLTFLISLALLIGSYLTTPMTQHSQALHVIGTLISLGLFGYILIMLKRNKMAQVVAILLSAVGLNAYQSNPHTVLDPEIDLDQRGELIVRLHEHSSDILEQITNLEFVISAAPLTEPRNKDATDIDDYYVVDVENDININQAIADLGGLHQVSYIEPNELLTLDIIEGQTTTQKSSLHNIINDPMIDRQWNLDVLRMDEYYPLFRQKKYQPIRAARLFVLDSGVDISHRDLSSYRSQVSPDQASNESDANGHGTHCAGVAAATTNNGLGVASMSPGPAWVQVTSVRVMNRFGIGSQARVIDGIIEAVDSGADVISLSLGTRSNQINEEAYRAAFDYAASRNVIVVAAAGNNAGDANEIVPANDKSVIAVSALNRNLRKAQFSNDITNTTYGIAAPGVSILSSWKNNGYSTFDGTSMAAPHVAGLIAVMRSIDPQLTTAEVYRILRNTGIDTPNQYQTGKMIYPAAAISALR